MLFSQLLAQGPIVMGILNLTPDSFYSGSRFSVQEVQDRAGNMLAHGAAILDLGGYSTRPGAAEVSEQDELGRVLPAIAAVRAAFPDAIISIDTFRQRVAAASIASGANVVNDVMGGRADAAMLPWIAATHTPYIITHSRGTPMTMNQLADYDDVVQAVFHELMPALKQLKAASHHNIVLDPGFGFAKHASHNFELLARLQELSLAELPILVGVSRKRMIWQTLVTDAANALHGTTTLHAMALERGASILRVHDVEPAVHAVKLYKAMTPYLSSTFLKGAVG